MRATLQMPCCRLQALPPRSDLRACRRTDMFLIRKAARMRQQRSCSAQFTTAWPGGASCHNAQRKFWRRVPAPLPKKKQMSQNTQSTKRQRQCCARALQFSRRTASRMFSDLNAALRHAAPAVLLQLGAHDAMSMLPAGAHVRI